jgi:hypothetical protein
VTVLLQSGIGFAKTRRIRPSPLCWCRTIDGMSHSPANGPSDRSEPLNRVRRRWWTGNDNGEPVVGWEPDTNGEWSEDWPSCPDGKPQRLCHALGFWERNVRELELRVLLGGDDGGVCQIIVDERDDEVYVRVLVCRCDEDDESPTAFREYHDWPARVWLERPLGDRAVIDVDTDEELQIFTPLYLDNVVQPDHGYRAANRRHRAPERP